MKKSWLIPFLLFFSCGGDDPCPCSGDPLTPLLVLTYSPKEIHFEWSASYGATAYRLYEDPHGTGDFAQIGEDLTETTYTMEISTHLFDWPNARFRVDACNGDDCTPSNEVAVAGNSASAVGQIRGSDMEPGSWFGSALAVSGDGSTLVVGAWTQGSSWPGDSGEAYIFTRSGAGWAERSHFKASNPQQNDYFGQWVAIDADGNTLAITGRDHTFILTPEGTGWHEEAFLPGAGPVALSDDGNLLVVGVSDTVRFFTRSGTDWTQQPDVIGSNTEAGDDFGSSLALSGDGNTLAVGAPEEDGAGNLSAGEGAVYVFTRSGTTWTQQKYLKPDNPSAGNKFGSSIDLSDDGDRLAAGSPSATNAELGAGVAHLFTRTGTDWTQEAALTPSDPQYGANFGSEVSFSGNGAYLAVGAPSADDNAPGVNEETLPGLGPGDVGIVYLFTRDTAWNEETRVQSSSLSMGDRFGAAVTLDEDGSEMVVGSGGYFSLEVFFY